MMTTQKQVRAAFRRYWMDHYPTIKLKRVVHFGDHRDYVTDVRVAFTDYVDMLARNGEISEALAQRVTL